MSKDMIGRTHVLITLGVMFTLGGAMRFLPDSKAIAAETQPVESTTNDIPVETETMPTPLVETTNPGQVCFSGETAVIFREDQKLLETERERLKEQQISLQAWQQEIDIQTAEQKDLQQLLETRWQEMQRVSDGDMQHLAQMYAAMKADEAAAIFNKMDPAFAAGFLRLLPSEQAGQIVARMETDNAYVVSIKLANMNNDIRNSQLSRE